MLRILSGFTRNYYNVWLRGTVQPCFSYDVTPDWFDDPIVKEALLDLDDIVAIHGVALEKRDGLVIPPEWLSHGCKQFISMTQDPSKVCDGYYFGWNVLKYFHKWSKLNNVDVTLLLNDSMCINEDYQMDGVLLNNGKYFKNNRDMAIKIVSTREVQFFGDDKDRVYMQKFKRDENDDLVVYGKVYEIQLT